MYSYKITPCPCCDTHDWIVCLYAHYKERARPHDPDAPTGAVGVSRAARRPPPPHSDQKVKKTLASGHANASHRLVDGARRRVRHLLLGRAREAGGRLQLHAFLCAGGGLGEEALAAPCGWAALTARETGETSGAELST
jgi:hypothetical protein